MDNWGTEEKKDNDIVRKILLAIIIMVAIIIIVILALLMIVKSNTFKLTVDGETKTFTTSLIKEVDNTTYIDIEELAKLLGNEYHIGEYKVFSSDADKCYIKSENETASFYLNSNKICKLPVDKITENYEEFTSEKNIIQINNKFYAPIDAAQIGFNIKIKETENKMSIVTLKTILTNLNKTFNKPTSADGKTTTYVNFLESDFNNQKAALYNYVIFCKNSSGLYGIMSSSGQEILPDKYQSIEFSESTQEFLVTNSLGKVGIIDANGQNKIEQDYDSIKVINSEPKLYLVSVSQKYGVLGEKGNTIIYPEYDSIGVDATIYKELANQYVLLNSAIPVCRDNKYGLFNIEGKKILDIKYDGIGYELKTIELNETSKPVNPVAAIEECNGIVVKNKESYGVYDALTGKELVPVRTYGIYYITNAGENIYYYAYKDKEYNLIQQLIDKGIISNPNEIIDQQKQNNNTVYNGMVVNNGAVLNANQTAQTFNNTVK